MVKAKTKVKAKAKSKAAIGSAIPSDRDWQAEDDARTLKRALEIKNDPKRMSAAQAHANKEMEAMKQISKMKGSVKNG